MQSWFTARSDSHPPPLAVPVDPPAIVQSARGAGIVIPPRLGDCTGLRPSWYPFTFNVCDWEFDPVDPDLTWREMTTEPPA